MTKPCLAVIVLFSMAACTPEMNWREVRFDNSPLVALLPCKPDRAVRQLPLGDVPRDVSMMGCEAGGAMFTVAFADVQDSASVPQALAQWKAVSKATQAQYFSHGSQVFEAAIFGKPQSNDSPSVLSTQAAETFFGGVSLPAKP
jgi:hypothetical protein